MKAKPLIWFLGITFLISWPLFLTPLLFGEMEATRKQWLTQGLWVVAMWGPGIAAIITTVSIMKQPFKTLRLNTLGPKRFYVWAFFLPVGLTVIGGLLTLLFGIAELDLDFTMMRKALAAVPGGNLISPQMVVGIQIAIALTLGPFFNVLFTLGEELGWRGFLLPQLVPSGQWKAMLLSGLVWGVWHAPTIAQGLNYPGYPVLGIFMMIIFCILLGIILAWLYLNTKSPWAAALGHGSVNAIAGLPVMFMKPGFNMAFGGTIATFPAWIAMAIFIGWLVWSKRLPVLDQASETAAIS